MPVMVANRPSNSASHNQAMVDLVGKHTPPIGGLASQVPLVDRLHAVSSGRQHAAVVSRCSYSLARVCATSTPLCLPRMVKPAMHGTRMMSWQEIRQFYLPKGRAI